MNPDGDLQFSVEPVLSSIAVAAAPALTVGGHAQLTATSTAVGGDNLPPLLVPIADPASHVWSSADPRVATVDSRTGVVTAHRPGTAVVSVTSGGVTAGTSVTVS